TNSTTQCVRHCHTVSLHASVPTSSPHSFPTRRSSDLFSPVRKTDDTGESYGQPGHLVVSDGPYMVQSYATGNGGKMVLVRNPKWNKASDPLRAALPDTWEVDFGIDTKVMDQRLMASAGKDNTAIQCGNIQPENLATIFTDTEHTTAQFNGRA